MSNPYAPPSTKEDAPSLSANKDTILRRVGALALAYIVVRVLWYLPQNVAPAIGATIAMSLCIYGFLVGKRKFHLGIALYMLLTISTQAFFMNRAVAHPERLMINLGPHPWFDFAISLIPNAVALVCATALYVRARRAA